MSEYKITEYTFKKAKQMGVEVKPSKYKTKKIDVYKNGKLIASIGAAGMMDYPSYILERGVEYANKRRELFYKRFGDKVNDMNSDAYWSARLLW